ncbi:MAG: hypothetical protein HXX08_01565 [Chloroflexi bacterium]|uniref:Membrane protein NfeD2 N-terminal transmembrane domain-containing protein n=1 Tax=Candidatus Chlorohelix allophototropha TaxID=3003348 RepID=A0A8T7LR83_9CHLR|nr:hypothetical protein [Chloroflexota bacterium]WJW66435.1 hypothetical protein OZ401_002233 [Chloroflexota bacterium L227-S17]
MEWLSGLFLGCFIFGLVFTVASFLLGGFSHFGGHDSQVAHDSGATHFHAGHHAVQSHGTGHNDNGRAGGFGWFSFNALVAFLTCFGAGGFILSEYGVPEIFTVPGALAIGLAAYFLVYLFIVKLLIPAQTPVMREEDYNLSGTVGKVTGTIFKGGLGEVTYTKFGTTRAIPARSVKDKELPHNLQVVILSAKDGVAVVDNLEELLAGNEQKKWEESGVLIEAPVLEQEKDKA